MAKHMSSLKTKIDWGQREKDANHNFTFNLSQSLMSNMLNNYFHYCHSKFDLNLPKLPVPQQRTTSEARKPRSPGCHPGRASPPKSRWRARRAGRRSRGTPGGPPSRPRPAGARRARPGRAAPPRPRGRGVHLRAWSDSRHFHIRIWGAKMETLWWKSINICLYRNFTRGMSLPSKSASVL